MPPSRAKSAFMFYQGAHLGEIKRGLGPDASMGDAMQQLSAQWKSLSEANRRPYLEREEEERQRYQRECLEADEAAYKAHQERTAKNAMPNEGEELRSSSRGARAQQDVEREVREAKGKARKEAFLNNQTAEERDERRAAKAAKRAEKVERHRARDAEEEAVADRHRKLEKEATKKSADRLKYLLGQSEIFGRLKAGKPGVKSEDDDKEDKNGDKYKSKHGKKKGRAKKEEAEAPEGEGLEEEDDEEAGGEIHTFLTKQPDCIKFGTLKPYQLEGLNWMIHLAEKGLNGILADEMGLGKTLQSISIMAYHYEYLKIQGPHLVCVPKSTLSNWMNELNRWCPCLRVIRFHGAKEEREALSEEYFTNEAAAHDGRRPTKPQILNEKTGEMEDDNSENPRAWDVCVTTYECANTERKVLSRFAWKYLVIDEAHRLKNEASMFSATVRSFNTANRLLLTGTPLQNNLHELWALLNFLLPDIFSSSEQFDEWFNLEVDDADAKKKMITQLHGILRPFMIRRMKRDVAKGLPPKTETLVMVGMSKMQKQLYKRLLLRDIEAITGKNTNSGKTAILNIVMQLRKCCNHPYLFEGIEDRSLPPLGQHLVDNCGKLNMVDKLLKRLKERGSRVLMFTQMTRILDILEDYMVMRQYKYCRIDGNTDYETRERSIDEFNAPNSEKFCFILSTRAGGLGINLQTADICILYDSDWNPQADLQAQDRCHRLGQKKPVSIYRLVTENTVEEKIVERAQQKLKLDAMVVQQGRLKEKDKVSKDEVMAAVRFGADAVFRSDESTITDLDIDVILERGKAKTEELASRIHKAEKGDLLDFRLDGGVSAQTFEGIDYSDAQLRKQLRLLAADSMGKRDRKPPPTTFTYAAVMQPTKSMVIKNIKVKLPKVLRLPRMEDHQFYNRARLMELSKLEFEMFASLRDMGQVPPMEYLAQKRTILPDEMGTEKLELLEEGFGDWTRSQFFHFVKATTMFGRDDIANIAVECSLPFDVIEAYSDAFWKYGSTELKADEWERVKIQIEKGEERIAKKRLQEELLNKFVQTFDDPEKDMVFANKGTTHFSLEQDRAILCGVVKHGYGNWNAIREEIRNDTSLFFQHTVQGMNIDAISKRCDYRMRQMEKELEAREKKLSTLKPPAVEEAEIALAAIKNMEAWDSEAKMMQLQGEPAPPMESFVKQGLGTLDEYLKERELCIDKLMEVETQIRGCRVMAEETKERIYAGDQYVNYSHITLKAGGPRAGLNKSGKGYGVDLESRINAAVLAIPECGECKFCLDPNSRKICLKRRDVRRELIEEEMIRVPVHQPTDAATKAAKPSSSTYKPVKERKKPGRKKGWNKAIEASPGYKKPKGASKGSIPMSLPERLLPEFCSRITANGTNQRMEVINGFTKDHPETSARQATIKFADLTTKDRPSCVPPPGKKVGKGRSVTFYVRPRFYHMLPEEERPTGWEEAAQADELLWQEECDAKAKAKAESDQKIRAMMTDKSGESDGEGTHNSVSEVTSVLTSFTGNDSDEESERPSKMPKMA
mmetsp:Transcript_17420/g.37613  ORF Transcript_17420/g.37613 Transcript_17420/m.37613 type:complete len:1527 (-) Transcript_17420:110-4690(-)|eukprot:CAMPEP_0172305822 /NCGR_PEP_ID=MMETSP1058-20130122/7038_1 /TAXON_ID=83371 /ORGANISM="Detonula confervacea, Strain CCMP 353" /LENGTH=1526 /DNA_ID=CAMNT_0013017537 /DNA_START=163 /DNA_END=4743 /DNA_ORIENTATION=+